MIRRAAGVVGVAVALCAVWFGTHIVRSSPVPANPRPRPGVRQVAQLTVSLDGIGVVDPATGDLRVLVPDALVSGFAWSPDGTELAYESRIHPCSLVVRTMATGSDRVLAPTRCVPHPGMHGDGASVDWSADGRWIAFAGPASGESGRAVLPVMMIHPDGTGETQLTDPDGFPITADAFSLSPDGSRIALGLGSQIHTMNVDGSGSRFLANGVWPDWSADGSTIAFERGGFIRHARGDPFIWQAWSIHADGSGLTKIDARKHCCLGLWATGPVWSPDGSTIAAVVRGRVRLMAADGGGVRTIPDITVSTGSLAWRPPDSPLVASP